MKEGIYTVKKVQRNKINEEETLELKKTKNKIKERIKKQKQKIVKLEDEIKETEAKKKAEVEAIKYKSAGDAQTNINNQALEIIKKLKENLDRERIKVDDIKKIIFKDFDEDDNISIYDLSNILSDKPCGLTSYDSSKLADYLIGNRSDNIEKQYTEERPLSEILIRLISIINSIDSKSKKDNEEDEFNIEKFGKMTEEELMLILQKIFTKINMKVIALGKPIEEIFADSTFTKVINKKSTKVITMKDFLRICDEKLEAKINPIEKSCFTKMMSLEGNEDLIKIKDFERIMKEFDNGSDDEGSEKGDLEFKDLDSVSLVIMFALTEYMMNSKIDLYKLFRPHIYQQEIEVEDHEFKIDLLDSKDFFDTLNKIGISIQEKEHDNLKAFLCIDPEYPDKLVIKKLKMAIEEFAVNETLRTC